MKLITLLFVLLSSVLQAQNTIDHLTHLKYDSNEVVPIMFNIYLDDQKVNNEYYFRMDNPDKDICFETTQGRLFVCVLTRNQRYNFCFKDKYTMPLYISLDTFANKKTIYDVRLYTKKKHNCYETRTY